MTLFFQQLGVCEAPATGDPIGGSSPNRPQAKTGPTLSRWCMTQAETDIASGRAFASQGPAPSPRPQQR